MTPRAWTHIDRGLLTLPAAAELFGIDLRTLQHAAKVGTLAARNSSGRLWETTEAEVLEWLATRRRGRRAATEAHRQPRSSQTSLTPQR